MATEYLFAALKLKVGNPLRQLILIRLADHYNADHGCFPSINKLAEECECSRQSVITHLAALEDAGLIKVLRTKKQDGSNKSNRYNFGFVSSVQVVKNLDHPLVKDLDHGSQAPVPETITKPISKQTYPVTDEAVGVKGWSDWVEYRKQIKKPLTKISAEKQINYLYQFPAEDRAEMISQSIRNQWQGLFEVKRNEKNKRNNRNDIASATYDYDKATDF